MNKVILMGRLTRDPDVRYSGNGSEGMVIARFTVAVDRRRTNANGEREADFVGCVAFSKQAEFAEKYLHQGSKVALVGRIQTGSYNNKDGQKVYTTDVVVEEVEFAESKAEASGRQNAPAPAPAQQAPTQTPAYAPQQPAQGYAYAPQQAQPTAQRPVVTPPQTAPVQPAAGEAGNEGFMNIPEGVENEGLPFN